MKLTVEILLVSIGYSQNSLCFFQDTLISSEFYRLSLIVEFLKNIFFKPFKGSVIFMFNIVDPDSF
jgi:hypothetical protein